MFRPSSIHPLPRELALCGAITFNHAKSAVERPTPEAAGGLACHPARDGPAAAPPACSPAPIQVFRNLIPEATRLSLWYSSSCAGKMMLCSLALACSLAI
jgi:hypothetical protein